MAVVVSSNGNAPAFEAKLTVYVFICVVIAAFGGLIFGYDIGISGGVTAMDDFLKEFFPAVWERKKHAHENNYCKYDNQFLQLFTSSLYLAALVASFFASAVCSKLGRKPTMQFASILFLIGVGLTAGAVNLIMLIFGRILLGFGVGFGNQLTVYVFICVVIAAFGGLIFGYDIGISGGVTAMDDFLKEFFPAVWERKKHAHENNYCKYDNQFLQLFTSSLYLAALVASFFASAVCSKLGRKPTMQFASIFFLIGVGLTAGAVNLIMLIFGRILLGFGVGFGNQAVPLFLSEIAPAQLRGGLNIVFQLMVTIGILIANLVNYFTAKVHPYGWRIALGGAAIPAVFLLFGSLIICETPTSLIERNKNEEGKEALRKIRGVEDINEEYESIVHACDIASQVKDPFRKLLKPASRPPFIIGMLLQLFQQFTGINAIMFYAPVLFQTVGFGSEAALLSAVITGTINVLSTFVGIYLVDKTGRRFLLLQSSVHMLICQLIIGIILAKDLGTTGTLGKPQALVVVIFVCVYVMGFAWSWGPLGWLIPSETFPLETRSAGFAVAVSCNMFFTFVIAQAFLSMLCGMRSGIFFFFSAWIVVMGLFAMFFIPETKGVAIDDMRESVWKPHWFWKRYMLDEDDVEKRN